MKFLIEKGNQPFLRVNDDPNLGVWEIPLPLPPPYKNIEGYGYDKKDQFFRYAQMPDTLYRLHLEGNEDVHDDDKTAKTIREIRDTLKKYQRQYRDEIRWIKLQHHRLEYGYHFFNNGVPTYMDRDHYGYINFWNIGSSREDELPEYRLRDSIFFHVTRAVEKARHILGLLYFKHRREGATFKAVCKIYLHAIREFKRKVGIQSLSGDHAGEVWKTKFVTPWQKLPFFMKPEWSGTDDPKDHIIFSPKAQVVTKRGALAYANTGLGSVMHAETSGIAKFDSHKLTRYYFDEFGKKHAEKPVDSFDRYMRIKETLLEGDFKVGTAFGTSTIGDEQEEEGGVEYAEKFYENSKYWEIPEGTMTNTGLRILFIPSYVNLTGFNDVYGDPIIEDNTGVVDITTGEVKNKGARTYLAEKLQGIIDKGNWVTINEEHRKFPVNFIDCFRTSSSNVTFNQVILTETIHELKKKRVWTDILKVGKIEPVDPRFPFGPMKFVPTISSVPLTEKDMEGSWMFSQEPQDKVRNAEFLDSRFAMGNQRTPRFIGEYTVSADPVKYEETKYGNKSKGAITVKRTHDPSIDTELKRMDEWETDCFVADWFGDVDDIDLFAYESLKACILFSTMFYGENNIIDVNRYFKKMGFHGYLMYEIDERGKISPNAGFSTQTRSKQSSFNKFSQYIERRGRYEKHIRILQQAKDCRSAKDLTNLDSLASAMGNLHAEENQYGRFVAKSGATELTLRTFYK